MRCTARANALLRMNPTRKSLESVYKYTQAVGKIQSCRCSEFTYINIDEVKLAKRKPTLLMAVVIHGGALEAVYSLQAKKQKFYKKERVAYTSIKRAKSVLAPIIGSLLDTEMKACDNEHPIRGGKSGEQTCEPGLRFVQDAKVDIC